MIYQLLRQRSSQDFLVTLSDSMRMGDELFSLLVYLCQGARLNGVRVGIVTQSPAVRAAFKAAGEDLPSWYGLDRAARF